MRFAAIYANGQRMGYSPDQMNRMSIWQYLAVLDGASAEDESLTEAEKDDLFEWLQSKD